MSAPEEYNKVFADENQELFTQTVSGLKYYSATIPFQESIRAVDFGVTPSVDNDNTSELQKALEFCNKKGRILSLPPGVIKTTKTLSVGFGTLGIVGQGLGNSTIYCTDPESDVLDTIGDDTYFSNFEVTHEVSDSDLKKGGNGFDVATGTGNRDKTQHERIFWESVRCRDLSSSGIQAYGGIENGFINSCIIRRVGRGGYTTNNSKNFNVVNSTFYKTGDDSVGLNVLSRGCTVSGCSFYQSGALDYSGSPAASGVKVHGKDISVSGCSFTECYNAVIFKASPAYENEPGLFSSSARSVVDGCTVNRLWDEKNLGEQSAFKVAGGRDVKFSDNSVFAVGTSGEPLNPLRIENAGHIESKDNTYWGTYLRQTAGTCESFTSESDRFYTLRGKSYFYQDRSILSYSNINDLKFKSAEFAGAESIAILIEDDINYLETSDINVFKSKASIAWLSSSLSSGNTIDSIPIRTDEDSWDSGLIVNIKNGDTLELWDHKNQVREKVIVSGNQSHDFDKTSISINSHTLSNNFDADNTSVVISKDGGNRQAIILTNNSPVIQKLTIRDLSSDDSRFEKIERINSPTVNNLDMREEAFEFLSGDGSTTQFDIPHGLPAEPEYVDITPNQPDATYSNIDYIDTDADNITVVFKSAPPSGSNNISLYKEAVSGDFRY